MYSEQNALCLYSNNHLQASHAQQLLEVPEYKTILAPYFISFSKELSDWCKDSYQSNPSHPSNLTHKSCSGNYVRSKSESIIDSLLYINKLPFRYECALKLGDVLIYPDFTIRHPVTGEFYYWEHFGLMDNPTYIQNACSKIQLYSVNGIVPSVNLITTFETKDYPLSHDKVQRIIEEYFL